MVAWTACAPFGLQLLFAVLFVCPVTYCSLNLLPYRLVHSLSEHALNALQMRAVEACCTIAGLSCCTVKLLTVTMPTFVLARLTLSREGHGALPLTNVGREAVAEHGEAGAERDRTLNDAEDDDEGR